MIQLRTLGRLELLAGEPSAMRVLPAQPKPLALLAFLAVATPRGPHRRDSLLALLWPELADEEARRALRQALHRVRYHVGDALLRTGRDDQIGVADDGVWCDAVAFEQALAAGRAAEALALYQGAFLDGVFVADASAEFQQWVDLTRTRLSAAAAAAASDLTIEARRSGDPAAEIRWATLASRLAPDDERLVRAVMRALGDRGDRAGALRVFQGFTERMAEDYDAEPADETAALADGMRTHRVLPDDRPAADPVISPALVAATENAVPQAAISRRKPRSRRLAWGAGLALVGLAVLGVIWNTRTPAVRSDTVLIADFRNQTHDSLLAGAVTEALRVDISQSRTTRVMSRAQVQSVLESMRQPAGTVISDAVVREVAERHGVKAFITGEVASLGNGFTVSAQLISVTGGEILASVRETAADSTQLLATVDRVSRHLRRGIGESLWAVRASAPLEQVTTSSLRALRLYSEAIRIGDQEGDDRRASVILRQAVALDTTFAMAYRKLGVYLRTFGEQAPADDALAHAFRFRKRLPELEGYHTAGTYYINSALPDSAIAAYRALLAVYPNDTRALNNLADVYENLKEFARAEILFRRAIETDSSISLIFNHLATDQFNGGRYDEAAHTLAARARRFPSQQDAVGIAIAIAMMRGQFDLAEQRTERMLVDAGSDAGPRAEVVTMLEGLAIMRGRLGDADRYRRTVAELRSPDGPANAAIELAIDLAFVEIWYRHQPVRGLALVDTAIARYPLSSIPPLDRNYALLAYVYALGGRPARARELLADMRTYESVAGTTRGGLGLRDEGGYLRALGTAELAEGRTGEAVETLRRSADLYFCPVCALPDLARALELAGAPDSAMMVYQRYLTTPWSEWMNAGGEFRGSAYLRLGALREARGDTALAIAAYDTAVGLWTGADAELQPLVTDARRRAAALRGRGVEVK